MDQGIQLSAEERETKSQVLLSAFSKDSSKFLELYQLWSRRIYFYFLRLTQHKETAEDLTADFFLKLIDSLCKYNSRGKFSSWLFTVAHNLAMDFFRREKIFVGNPPYPSTETACWQSAQNQDLERIILLKQAVSRLSITDQELLHLRFYEGLTYAQMAEVVGKKEQSLKKATYRILEILGNEIGVNHE